MQSIQMQGQMVGQDQKQTVVLSGVNTSAPLLQLSTAAQPVFVSQAPPPPYPVHLAVNTTQPRQLKKGTGLAQSQKCSETDKKAIYKHTLFQLVAMLLDKCEFGTQTCKCLTSEQVNAEVAVFRPREPTYLDITNELDELMIKTVEVLRIHLLELEKVNDLCQDFCTRYISCLKSKLHNQQLFAALHDDEEAESTGSSPRAVPTNVMTGGGTIFQMIQTPQGLVAHPLQIQAALSSPLVVHSAARLVQVASNAASPQVSTATSTAVSTAGEGVRFPGGGGSDDDSRSQRRSVLPKQATQALKSWLFQHIVHPYPTDEEKKQLSAQTNLSILQINNWFINARRRILQPMLETSAAGSHMTGERARKVRPLQSRPQKYWPENIANLVGEPDHQEVVYSGQLSEEITSVDSDTGSKHDSTTVMTTSEACSMIRCTTPGDVTAEVYTIITNVQNASQALQEATEHTYAQVQDEVQGQWKNNFDKYITEHSESHDLQQISAVSTPQIVRILEAPPGKHKHTSDCSDSDVNSESKRVKRLKRDHVGNPEGEEEQVGVGGMRLNKGEYLDISGDNPTTRTVVRVVGGQLVVGSVANSISRVAGVVNSLVPVCISNTTRNTQGTDSTITDSS